MAAPIEQLLKSAKTLNAEQLILEAGKSALVLTGGGIKELTKTQLTPYDIFKLISPIMPEDKKVALVGQPSTEFRFGIDGVGEFDVTVIKESNGIKVMFRNPAVPASQMPLSAEPAPSMITTQPFTGKPPLPPTQPISAQPISAQPISAQPITAQPVSAQPFTAQPFTAQPFTAQPVSMPLPPTGELPKNYPAAMPPPPTAALPKPPMAQPATPIAQPAPPPIAQSVPMAQPVTTPPPLPSAQPVPMAHPVPISHPVAQPATPPSAQPVIPSATAVPPTPTAMLAPTTALPPGMGAPPPEGTAPLDAQQRAGLAQNLPLQARPATPPMATPATPPNAQPIQPVQPVQPAQSFLPSSTPSTPSSMSSTASNVNINTMSRPQFAQTTERQRLKVEVDRLLERTVKMRGSDLHMATGAVPIVRRFGTLIRLEGDAMDGEKARLLIRELLTDDQYSRFEKTNDLDFSYEIFGVGRFRGNVLRQYRGIDLTFHIVPAEIMPPEELGLPALVRDITRHHQGLVLITGASGQGKSTTISSLVDVINSERPLHIITVEDPIEFVHPIDKRAVVNQREVGRHTLSFANALRAALREDPDVIVVGEMRDLETISLAITAAETGHLVMGTLMTSSAHQTVDRILESFPPAQQNQVRAMLSESLRAVISQRLLPRADDNGMVLAAEILLGTPAVANLIRDKKTFQIPSVIQTNRNLGMKRMDDALLELVVTGLITPQKGLEFALDKKAFESAITR